MDTVPTVSLQFMRSLRLQLNYAYWCRLVYMTTIANCRDVNGEDVYDVSLVALHTTME